MEAAMFSRFSVRQPFVVIAIWLAIVGAGFGIGTGVFERLVTDVGHVPSSESARAADRLSAGPADTETLTAIISGPPADDTALTTRLRAIPGVDAVSQPMPSTKDPGTRLLEVGLASGDDQSDVAETVADRLHAVEGTQVIVSGGPLTDDEFDQQAQKDVARAELLSTPVVLILLLIVFGGLLAAGLPLLIAMVGVAGTFGVLYAFSSFTDVSVYAIQITTMLSVGLAVDYALLIVNRFREERRTDPDVLAALARTTAT